MKTYGVKEMAAILKIKEQSVRTRLMRNPESLPPCIRHGFGVPVIWLEEDVKKWMKEKKNVK